MYRDEKYKEIAEFENTEPKNFGNLTTSILKRIFMYLNKHDVQNSVSLVCKHWHYAAKQTDCLRSFSVSSDMMLPKIFNHLRKSGDLLSLHLDNIDNVPAILKQTSKCVINLKQLSLKNYSDLDPSILTLIIAMFPGLQKLNLEQTTIEGDAPAYSRLLKLRDLRSINLTNIHNMSLQNFLEIIFNCRKLEELDISLIPSSMKFEDDIATIILNHIRQNLKSLNIDCRSLTHRSFMVILRCNKLERLIMNYALNFRDDLFLNFWSNFPKLKMLGFPHLYTFSVETSFKLFDHSSAHIYENVKYLDFTFCLQLTDFALDIISKSCPKLEEIHLKSCRLLSTIKPIYKNCYELKVLNIAFCCAICGIDKLPKKLNTLIVHQLLYTSIKESQIIKKDHMKIWISLSEYTDALQKTSKNNKLYS